MVKVFQIYRKYLFFIVYFFIVFMDYVKGYRVNRSVTEYWIKGVSIDRTVDYSDINLIKR